MYRLRVGVIHVLLVIATIVLTFEDSMAFHDCKTVVMEKLMKKCRFEPRIKRESEKFDLEKLDYKFAKLGIIDAPESSHPDFHKEPHKGGEFSAENIPRLVLPKRSAIDKENGKIHKRFYRSASLMSASKLLGSDDVLGFDLSTEEIEELYNEIFERPPRSSKDDAWNLFKHSVKKCCQDIEVCKKNEVEISCIFMETLKPHT